MEIRDLNYRRAIITFWGRENRGRRISIHSAAANFTHSFYNRAQCNFQAEYPYDLFRLGPKSCNKK
jgi:hypothetical protein